MDDSHSILIHHLPLSIEPIGTTVITTDGTTKSTLALVQELTSVKHVDKRYWWFDEVGKGNVDLKFIEDTLTHHLPLEWKGIPLEPVGPAVLHVEKVVNRHLPLEIEPVGPKVITTWQLALDIVKLINNIKIGGGCDLTPLIERIGELEKLVRGCSGRTRRWSFSALVTPCHSGVPGLHAQQGRGHLVAGADQAR